MKYLISLFAVLSGTLLFAQTEYHYDRCGTYQAMQEQEASHPGYLNGVDEVFMRAKEHEGGDRSTVYTIPVVVHIVHNTPEENLADSVIFNQIAKLNEDFRRMNIDTVNLRDTFITIVGDSFIEFQLATVDPDGNPTTGITRTSTTVQSFLGVGGTPAEGVKSTAAGGIDPWDQDHYLNIWVCDMSLFSVPFLLGYATPPDGLPHWPSGSTAGMSDGVVIQYEAFGGNNPNVLDIGNGPMDVLGRTTVHEVGHYLGLRHIWADGDCLEEDGVDDTPNAVDQSNFDCNFAANTCVDNIGTLGDLPDMVENYMDYSEEACQNSFTLGQVDIMRGVLEVERWDLVNGNPALGIPAENAQTFEIYPNPTNGNITITGLPEGNNQINIYNETGQLVNQLNSSNSFVEVDGLIKGVYIVTVNTQYAILTKKLVVI